MPGLIAVTDNSLIISLQILLRHLLVKDADGGSWTSVSARIDATVTTANSGLH
jgi:hypothetical protein